MSNLIAEIYPQPWIDYLRRYDVRQVDRRTLDNLAEVLPGCVVYQQRFVDTCGILPADEDELRDELLRDLATLNNGLTTVRELLAA